MMKAAVVTGASSGLGREFAKQISAKYGKLDEVWLIARRRERLLELQEELRIPARIFAMDLTDPKELEHLKRQLEELAPDIKLLVNCAGYGRIGRFDELDIEDQCGMIDLNCKALTLFTGLCLPFISNHSRIVNTASAAAFSPQPGFNVYAATKAYVLSYSRALHAELKDRRITVTAVCPGPVSTEFFDIAGDSEGAGFKKKFRSDPQKVVAHAIRDAALGNDISVYGMAMKSARVASKVVPNGLIMNFFRKG